MDSFLTTHTRLVVIVDGLDSCEQEKLLQVIVINHGFSEIKTSKIEYLIRSIQYVMFL